VKRNLRQEVGVGLFVVAAAALTGWMAIQAGAVGLGERIEVSAVFDNVVGLSDGAAVLVAGVEVGKVTGLRADFDRARVDLSLDPEANLRLDVEAIVRARSVLGEKYVEILPVGDNARLLRDGDEIVITRSGTEIDEVVGGLGPLLELVEPERLRHTFDALLKVVEADPDRLERMAQDLEAVTRNLRTFSEDAVSTGQRASLLVDEARHLVADLSGTSEHLEPLIERADKALVDLERAAADLPEATAQLQPTLAEAQAALADLRTGMSPLSDHPERLELILQNLSELDKWELRRLLREEGILVRMSPREVIPE